jgi:hypothetical protein
MALAGVGCSRSTRPLDGLFPRDLDGWRLVHLHSLAMGDVPDDIRRLGAREAVRGTYEGRGTLELTLYDMANRKSAYAVLRLAHETGQSVPFFRDRYFGLAESGQADHEMLAVFSRAFEQHLAAQ